MTKGKNKRLFVSILMMLLGLTTISPGAFTAQASAAPAAAPAAATTTIRFATYGAIDGWEELFAEFSARHPEIKVEYQIFTYAEYIDKMMTMMAGGNPPDVILTWAQYKPTWVAMGLLHDLTSRWEQSSVIKQTRFYPFILEGIKYNGKIWGVPYDFNSKMWFHHLDAMAEAGLNPPTDDWDIYTLRSYAQKLTSPEKRMYGTNNPFVTYPSQIQWIYNWTGHEWLDETRTKVLVDEPQVVEAFNFWNEMRNVLHVTPGYPGAYTARGDTFTGGYAMWEGWLSYAPAYINTFNYNWGVTLMPKAPSGQAGFAQGHLFSIPIGAKNIEAAWTLLEWIGSYEGQKAFIVHRDRQPSGPYPELWDLFFAGVGPERAPKLKQWVAVTFYGADLARVFNYWDTYPEVTTIMTQATNNIMSRGASVRNELINAASQIRALLADTSR
ncbi:MAG TPA: sugar ABC transporter substrate-binding protein [Firmicutes bacterium]|nr:sugar ABC transporter substrate-binding protein [Bacillota bacterium]